MRKFPDENRCILCLICVTILSAKGGRFAMPSKTLEEPRTVKKLHEEKEVPTVAALGGSDYTADKIQKLEGVRSEERRVGKRVYSSV